MLLSGTLLLPSGPVEGQLLIEQQRITCVAAGTGCGLLPDAGGATAIDTQGIIAPGLIDVSTNALFSIFDGSDWSPRRFYTNHNQWPLEPEYLRVSDAMAYLSSPTSLDLRCELVKWAKLRAMFSGTTSLVGRPGGAQLACFGGPLPRLLDSAQNGFDAGSTIRTSISVPDNTTALSVCAAFAAGSTLAYVIDIAEGLDVAARNEFVTLQNRAGGCLRDPRTTLVHGTALDAGDFSVLADAGMSLALTPYTDLSLYGATAAVPAAQDAGVNLALATGFPLINATSLLASARALNAYGRDAGWSPRPDARALFDMMTRNAARAVGQQGVIGSLTPGAMADVIVVAGDRTNPYDAVLAARPDSIRLTIVGGKILSGDLVLQPSTDAGCESVRVCSAQKFACVAVPGATANRLGQTMADVQSALVSGLTTYDTLQLPVGAGLSPIAPVVTCQ